MKTTLMIYIAMGVLFIVPLVVFNLRKIVVYNPIGSRKINWMRLGVISFLSVFIAFFLVTAYHATLFNRYEIALEKLAQQHAEMLLGKKTPEEFRTFLVENGTDAILENEKNVEFSQTASSDKVRFQLSSDCTPKYWKGLEGFAQAPIISEDNPLYMMYLLEQNGQQRYYTVRLVRTDKGWKYDWFGNANETHQSTIETPSARNGKWYTVLP